MEAYELALAVPSLKAIDPGEIIQALSPVGALRALLLLSERQGSLQCILGLIELP